MKPIVLAHTIDQWNTLSPETQTKLLKGIRLKERLLHWLENRADKKHIASPEWAPCSACNPKNSAPLEQRGWMLHEPRYPGIHPSQVDHPCNLKLYNEMISKEAKSSISGGLQMIFDIGSYVHLMFQNYGKNGAWGEYYYPESAISGEHQMIAKELMLEGSADAENIIVIDEYPEATYEVGVVHEYKTINENGFRGLRGPKPIHVRQATIYAVALNRPVLVFLYMNKNDSSLFDFPVAVNMEIWESIRSRAEFLKQAYDTNTPPAGDVGQHCKECAYAFNCDELKKARALRLKPT